jgi:hypothetical protein
MILKVITVVKDDLPGLKRTQQSVLDQSKKVSWTLVTPNDGSATFQYIQELRNSGIVDEIILDTHQGIYSAMNQAIALSRDEEWLWFLNAGDEFANDNTYELVDKCAHVSSNLWMYGGHFLGSQAGRILGEMKTPHKFKPSNQLFAKKYISHQSTIFYAKFLQDLGGFNCKLKIAADWDLMVRAWAVDSGQRIPESLSVFYMGGLSTASRQSGNVELFRIRKIHLGPNYVIKNYWWFGYRVLRNYFVQSVEENLPNFANSARKVRLRVKAVGNKLTADQDIFL